MLDQTFNGGDSVTTDIRLTDIDRDGDLDIVLNDFNQGVFKQMNDGSGNFSSPVFVPGTGPGSWEVETAPIYFPPVLDDPYDNLVDFTIYFLTGAELSGSGQGAATSANGGSATFSFIAINGQSLADGAVVTTDDGLRISDAGGGKLNIDTTGFDSSGAPVASGYYVAGTASFEYTIEDENGNISTAEIDLTIWGEQGSQSSESEAAHMAADLALPDAAALDGPRGGEDFQLFADLWIRSGTADTPAELYSEAFYFASIDAL